MSLHSSMSNPKLEIRKKSHSEWKKEDHPAIPNEEVKEQEIAYIEEEKILKDKESQTQEKKRL